MAADFFHHVVVSGSRAAVLDFAERIALVVTRRAAGETTRYTVPFSLESLQSIARMKGRAPSEPYDMVRWPPTRGPRPVVRYRFHTRNILMQPLLRRLSKAMPRVTFALVTLALDDSDFGAFTISKGKVRGRWLGGKWRQQFWERTSKEMKMPLDECYEDPRAERRAESLMFDAAMAIATGGPRRYTWSGGETSRRYEDERDEFISDLAERMNAMASSEGE